MMSWYRIIGAEQVTIVSSMRGKVKQYAGNKGVFPFRVPRGTRFWWCAWRGAQVLEDV